ncbi:MAG TPA: cobaltochelatase subunit CobN, partial [Aurantimonas sp.]|nr:cobaltochelatase subunit CobN [Aurantimonas sp.]
MHLLLAQQGTVDDGGEAIDLGQSPADIVVLSAADTEIAGLAFAARRLGGEAPSLRLANLLRLKHPMSVDAYVSRTLRHARLVVVRLLGGAAYWPYGLDALLANAQASGGHLVVLPGDDKPDPGLDRYCTVSPEIRNRLWAYLVEGGADNADNFLLSLRALIDGGDMPAEAQPLLKAGVVELGGGGPQSNETETYPPLPAGISPTRGGIEGGEGGVFALAVEPENESADTSDRLISPLVGEMPGRAEGGASRKIADAPKWPLVAIVCYRALVQSGQTEPVEALARALAARGLHVLPVYISSLKDPVSVETLRALFARKAPAVVINLTGFAVSSPGGERVPTVLEEEGAVVLQAVLASGSRESWEASPQGLSARDLAMNVALPEVDGRVLSRAIAFKSAG